MAEGQAVVIDGRAVARDVREGLAERVRSLAPGSRLPGLAVIRVGDDPASEVYVLQKRRAAAGIGNHIEEHAIPSSTSNSELLAKEATLKSETALHCCPVHLTLLVGLYVQELD